MPEGRQKMENIKRVKHAYHESKDVYDNALTSNGFWFKLYNRIVWGIDDQDYVGKVLSYIPDDFCGRLLDVPAGTAVHTFKKYAGLNDAQIIALDDSDDMLIKARERLGQFSHVKLFQGDVGALPFDDASFDIVFSMNGFHAFPDKQKAFEETGRVLKADGVFCGCFYIKGQRRVTDFFVRTLYVVKGWFTPPFYTIGELQNFLVKRYRKVWLCRVKSIVCFYCVK